MPRAIGGGCETADVWAAAVWTADTPGAPAVLIGRGLSIVPESTGMAGGGATLPVGGGGGGVAVRSGAGAGAAWRIHTADCAMVSPNPVYAMDALPGVFTPGTPGIGIDMGISAACSLILGSSAGANLHPKSVQPPFSAKHSSWCGVPQPSQIFCGPASDASSSVRQ